MDQDERLRRMERGRGAMLAESIAAPYIEDMIRAAVNNLVSAQRGRSLEHDYMVAAIGGISALMALNDTLETEQRQGDMAAHVELGDGKA